MAKINITIEDSSDNESVSVEVDWDAESVKQKLKDESELLPSEMLALIMLKASTDIED